MGQGARGWCTGMTKSHGMGREVREEFRMGNTCTPMADSWQAVGLLGHMTILFSVF